MDHRVIFSYPALGDLESIVRFIAAKSASAGELIGLELFACCESLNSMPHRGTIVQDRAGLRKLSHRYYLIYYRVGDDSKTVDIIRIWDGRRNPATLVLETPS